MALLNPAIDLGTPDLRSEIELFNENIIENNEI